MSLATLLGETQRTRIGSLVLDCLIRETHGIRSKATAFPVEDGSNSSDHVINEPREIQIEGLITNSPIIFIVDRVKQIGRGDIKPNYAELAFAELERIHDQKELVDIVGKFRTYKSMAMLEAPVVRDGTTGDALRFTALFRQIRKVALRTAAFRGPPTRRENAQPPREQGKAPTRQSTAQEERAATTAKALVRGVTNFFGGGQ